ncbi:MAG: hypothetical protein ACI4ST_02390 [Candidatus Gallimonas sp.]
MTRKKVIRACVKTVEEMRKKFVPNPKTRGKTSTGNMAFHALQYSIEGDVFHIYIDERIAPYVMYTEEPWISPKWNGKKNPNEGWWERFGEEFARRLAKKLRGNIQ